MYRIHEVVMGDVEVLIRRDDGGTERLESIKGPLVDRFQEALNRAVSVEETLHSFHERPPRLGGSTVFWVITKPVISEAEEPALTVAPAKMPGPGGTCDSAVVLGRTTYFDGRRGNAEDADAFHEDADELRARIARGE